MKTIGKILAAITIMILLTLVEWGVHLQWIRPNLQSDQDMIVDFALVVLWVACGAAIGWATERWIDTEQTR